MGSDKLNLVKSAQYKNGKDMGGGGIKAANSDRIPSDLLAYLPWHYIH